MPINSIFKHVLPLFLLSALQTPGAVPKHSDVVFMYQADAKTYAQYGATAVSWGRKPTPKALAEAAGMKFFGSVGMVTEFAQYYQRFPQNYEQGLCRDINGQPVKVPWLTDHQYQGIPYWWCCTQQPLFRQYLSERVVETVKAGAQGVHIDDHKGTSGGLWLGICFCDRCVEGFRSYLGGLSAEELKRFGIEKPGQFNFSETVKQWLALEQNKTKKPPQHPLWGHWTIYQNRAAAAFMQELRELAAGTAGHPVPMGANAGLLWPRHLADYQSIDLFSAETDHHASARKFSDTPIFAYRLADAVQRPYASTASGQDWAFIKEQNLPGLVRGWIALSYASGHCLMVPHHQWCYTPQKGTHWYDGPAEKFAPLYQFARRNAGLLDGYDTYADIGIVLPHRAFVNDASRWFGLCNQLAATNISYRLLLAGDEIVDHPLSLAELNTCPGLLIPDVENLLPADRKVLEEGIKNKRVFSKGPEALAGLRPAVQVEADGPVRAFPRVKPGSVVVHLLNYAYDASRDDVRPLKRVKVRIDAKAFGVSNASACKLVRLEEKAMDLPINNQTVTVPELGLWAILVFQE